MAVLMKVAARVFSLIALIAGLLSLLVLSADFASGDSIDACGVVSRRGSCRVFTIFSADYPYECILPDTVSVAEGTECRVRGTFEECIQSCGSGSLFSYCLTEVHISACIPESLGCGRLSLFDDEYGCYLWRSFSRPDLEVFVDDRHGYASGDTLFATGIIARIYGDICLSGDPTLLHTTLSACPDTISPVAHVTWGQIKSRFR
jgi:hypothetical protein